MGVPFELGIVYNCRGFFVSSRATGPLFLDSSPKGILMYLKHFGLQSDPFRLDPSLDYVFVSKSHEETIAHLVYGIEQGEDFVLITGEIGTGKTLALHFLLDQIVSSYQTAFVNVTQINFLELLKLILDDFEVDFDRRGDRADLLAILKQYLKGLGNKREKALIVVDEAQNLDVGTLEGLRLLSNLTQPGPQLLQIVLAGQPGLLDKINSASMEQLKQRIRVKYNLEHLSRSETGPYIMHRMSVAGCADDVFSSGALDRIYELSQGVPRLVNQYAGAALLSAFVGKSKKVKTSHVEEDSAEDVLETPAAQGSASLQTSEKVETEIPQPDPVAVPQKETAPELRHQAMSALDDVDLDTRRNARNGRTKAVPKRRSHKPAIALWIFIPFLLLASGWYILTQTTLVPESTLEKVWPSRTSADTRSVTQTGLQGQDVEATAEGETVELLNEEPLIEEALNQNSAATDLDTDVAAVDPVKPVILESTEPTATISPEPKFAIHVASFLHQTRAADQLAAFHDDGIDAFSSADMVDGNEWVRIYLGPYEVESDAKAYGKNLRDRGVIEYYQVIHWKKPTS